MTNKTWALQVCEEQNKTMHIHSNSDGILAPPTCTECCHTDLCNAQGCGQPGMTKGALSPDRLKVLLLFEYYSLVDNYFYYICSLLFFLVLLYFINIFSSKNWELFMINAYTVGRFLSCFGAPTSRLSSITRKRASLLGMFAALRQSRVSGNSPLQELRGNRNHFIFHNLWLKTKLFFIEYIHMYMQHHLWNVFYFSFALLKKSLNLETKYIHLDVCLFRYSKFFSGITLLYFLN